MIDQTFKELSIGQKRRSAGRTFTETDVVNFCMMTGNWLELHANVDFAKTTPYGQRLVQGGLVFVVVNALLPFDSEVVAAFYGVDNLRFIKPTFIQDTLRAETEIVDLREKDLDHGVVTLNLKGINQRDETVLSCDFKLLVRQNRLSSASAQANGQEGGVERTTEVAPSSLIEGDLQT